MHTFIDTDVATVRVLLDLADRPRDVATSTDYSGLSVVVPDYLYERWLNYQSLEASSPKEPKNGSKKK